MSKPTDNATLHVLNEFLARYLEDRDAGKKHPVEHYQAMFPGFEEVIAAEYTELDSEASESTEEPESTPVLERLGPYRLVREIGHGGQGVVYLAEQEDLGRPVALKLLSSRSPFSREVFARFRHEAEMASRLQHPGICTVFDAGEIDGVAFIAMQFVEGESLSAKITRAREAGKAQVELQSLPSDDSDSTTRTPSSSRSACSDIVKLMELAARAVHSVHQVGIVHRDLKPGNILVNSEGRPVVLDFGLAREDALEGQELTRSGDVLGTPAYLPPERVSGERKRADARTDVYGLGVSLYECLTLRRPFESATRDGLYRKILGEEAARASKLNRRIPRDLEVVLQTAMEKDPERRYQSALDLAEDLRRVRSFEPIRARAVGPILRARRWVQRNPIVTGLLVVLAAALAISVVAMVHSRLKEKQALESDDKARSYLRSIGDLLLVEELKDLESTAADLWPAAPERIPRMKEWLRDAERLGARLPGLRELLREMRAGALPRSEKERERDRREHPLAAELQKRGQQRATVREMLATLPDEAVGERIGWEGLAALFEEEIVILQAEVRTRCTYRFKGDVEQSVALVARRHELLAQLVQAMVELVHGGRFEEGSSEMCSASIPAMRRRLARAEAVASHGLGDPDVARDWDRVCADVLRRDGPYGGIAIEPIPGLVPLRKNPRTGLWEFWHPGSGERPAPNPDWNPDTARGEGLAAGANRWILTADTGLVMVLIPGGRIPMGAQRGNPDGSHFDLRANADIESPVHTQLVDPFLISKYELTQGQWIRFAGTVMCLGPQEVMLAGRSAAPLHPVECVTWTGCKDVLSRMGLDIPKETQWECACRAMTETPWWSGEERDSLVGVANVADRACRERGLEWPTDCEAWDDGYARHAPVGSFAANPFGLHDVHGNVQEWCRDVWASYEGSAGDANRRGGRPGERILRGGSFRRSATAARASSRNGWGAGSSLVGLGVRPVLDFPSWRALDGSRLFGGWSKIALGISSVYEMKFADVDGDGDLDLFVIPSWTGARSLYLNDGTGAFRDVTATHLPLLEAGAEFGDIDGDGDLDLLVGNGGWHRSARISLHLNDGDGVFAEAEEELLPPIAERTTAIALGDLDADGDLDFVSGNFGQSARIYFNTDGKFVDGDTLGAALHTQTLVLGDVDGDGDLDCLQGNLLGQRDRLYANDGRGEFNDVTKECLPPYASDTGCLRLFDADSDGDLDILACAWNMEYVPLQNRLYLNDGKGRFVDATEERLPPRKSMTKSAVVSDVDGDGDMDILFRNEYEEFRLLLNDGRGYYSDGFYLKPEPGNLMTAADIDTDGKDELVIGSVAEGSAGR